MGDKKAEYFFVCGPQDSVNYERRTAAAGMLLSTPEATKNLKTYAAASTPTWNSCKDWRRKEVFCNWSGGGGMGSVSFFPRQFFFFSGGKISFANAKTTARLNFSVARLKKSSLNGCHDDDENNRRKPDFIPARMKIEMKGKINLELTLIFFTIQRNLYRSLISPARHINLPPFLLHFLEGVRPEFRLKLPMTTTNSKWAVDDKCGEEELEKEEFGDFSR